MRDKVLFSDVGWVFAQFSHVHVSENEGMQTELTPRQAVVIVLAELCHQADDVQMERKE